MTLRRASVLLASMFVAIGGGWAAPARAGAISVMPVRVDVSSGQRFCSLTLGNDSAQPVTVQVRGFAWTRDEGGADILTPDEGFLVNPPIATIAPRGSRLVRCSLPADTAGQAEKQWRLIVDELPDATQAQPGIVQTLLRLSVPVFRGGENAAPQFTASASAQGVRLANTGSGHAKVISLTLSGTSGTVTLDKPFYLLAGGVQLVPSGRLPSGRLPSGRLPSGRLPSGLSSIRIHAEEGDYTVALSTP